MTKYINYKLTVLYTMLIVMVVYIHSSYPQGKDYPVADFFQKFIYVGICSVANCLLMIITAVIAARLLKKFTPRVYAVLTGGR